jgi:hypothetical protein
MLALGLTVGGEIPLDQIPQNGVAWKLLAEFSRPLASHNTALRRKRTVRAEPVRDRDETRAHDLKHSYRKQCY